MVDSQSREVYLSLRDIIAITGLAITILGASWAFSADTKSQLARITEKLQAMDDRVRQLEDTLRDRRPIVRAPIAGE